MRQNRLPRLKEHAGRVLTMTCSQCCNYRWSCQKASGPVNQEILLETAKSDLIS